jgi:hypothetical protein
MLVQSEEEAVRRCSAHQEAIAALEQQHQQALSAMEQQHHQALAAMQQQHAQALTSTEQQHTQALTSTEQEHKQALAVVEAALAWQREQHENEVISLLQQNAQNVSDAEKEAWRVQQLHADDVASRDAQHEQARAAWDQVLSVCRCLSVAVCLCLYDSLSHPPCHPPSFSLPFDNNRCLSVHNPRILICQYPRAVLSLTLSHSHSLARVCTHSLSLCGLAPFSAANPHAHVHLRLG